MPQTQNALQQASRRPAFAISAPLISRHVVLLIKGAFNPVFCESEEQRNSMWNSLIYKINTLKNSLCKNVTIDSSFYNCENFALQNSADPAARPKRSSMLIDFPCGPQFLNKALQTPIGRELCKYFKLDGSETDSAIRFRIRIDINTETIGITTAIYLPPLGNRNASTDSLFRYLIERIESESDRISRNLVLRFFYCTAWDFMDYCIINTETEEVWSKLSDFRGITLSTSSEGLPVFPCRDDIDHSSSAIHGNMDRALLEFLKSRVDLIHDVIKKDYAFVKLDDFLRSIENTICYNYDYDALSLARISEGVVCGMLGGRILYCSSIASFDETDNFLTYLVVYSGKSQSQLGRFLRRLHIMGELRTSALIDYDKGLKRPSVKRVRENDLERAQWEILKAFEQITEMDSRIESLLPNPSGLPQTGQAPSRGKKIDFARKVNTIASTNRNIAIENAREVELKSIRMRVLETNTWVSGGMLFRANRSLYYANTFKAKMPDLAIVPLSDFQSYDAYMRRYLFQLFDKIESIGRVYADVLGKIDEKISHIEQSRMQKRSENLAVIGTLVAFLIVGRDLAGSFAVDNGIGSLFTVFGIKIGLRFAVEFIVTALLTGVVCDILFNGRRIISWFFDVAIKITSLNR